MKYQSKNKTISKSLYHQDLWIVDLPDGTFYSVEASAQQMLAINPPNKPIKLNSQRR